MANPGQVALVTGAGSGIGEHVAIALAKAGYQTVLTGRRLDRLEAVAGKIADAGGTAIPFAANVGDPTAVGTLFDAVKSRCGRLDLLFNNAGVGLSPGLLEDLTFEQWTSVVSTNLTGVFLCIQGAFRIMKAQTPMGGRIINNGSISAHAPRPNSAPYTATKHAVTGLTKSAALDGRKYDIAVGQIDIGNAASDMTSAFNGGVPQADGSIRPEPVMDVRHVVDGVLYMAGLPLDANVQFLTVLATKMPYIGRG